MNEELMKMLKSKILIPCLLTVLVSACAQTSDVMNVGGGIYMISAAASSARGGASGALDLAAKDANKFCAQSGRGEAIIRMAKNKDVYQSSFGGSWASGAGSFSGGTFAAGRARLTFRCSGNNQSTVVSNASSSVDKITLPLKMDWEGFADNMTGIITVPDLRKWQNPEVPVEVKFETSSYIINCNGSSIAKKGDWDKGEISSGVFVLKCSNGRSITGKYISPTAGQGIGDGKDDSGASVIYVYGKSAAGITNEDRELSRVSRGGDTPAEPRQQSMSGNETSRVLAYVAREKSIIKKSLETLILNKKGLIFDTVVCGIDVLDIDFIGRRDDGVVLEIKYLQPWMGAGNYGCDHMFEIKDKFLFEWNGQEAKPIAMIKRSG